MLRAWSAFGCLTVVAALAAAADSLPFAPASLDSVAGVADSTRGDEVTLPEGVADSTALPVGVAAAAIAGDPEDLVAALRTLQALQPDLPAVRRAVFDELVDAAGEMAAGGDSAAARLLIADARRLLEPQEKP